VEFFENQRTVVFQGLDERQIRLATVMKICHKAVRTFGEDLDVTFIPPFAIGNFLQPRPLLHHDRRLDCPVQKWSHLVLGKTDWLTFKDNVQNPSRAQKATDDSGGEEGGYKIGANPVQ